MEKILFIAKNGIPHFEFLKELAKQFPIDYLSTTHPIFHKEKKRKYHPPRNAFFNYAKVNFLEESFFKKLTAANISPLQKILPNPLRIQPYSELNIASFLAKNEYGLIIIEEQFSTSVHIDIIRKILSWTKVLIYKNSTKKNKIDRKADFVLEKQLTLNEKIDFIKNIKTSSTKSNAKMKISMSRKPSTDFPKLPPAKFPIYKNPAISVILLSHNNWQFTDLCLRSLAHAQSKSKIKAEYILIDNASTDETVKEAKKISGLRFIENKKNIGFPAGINQGIKLRKGRDIVLLNNDTIVPPHWLDTLASYAEKIPNLGILGPSTNTESGQSDEKPYYYSVQELFKYQKNLSERKSGQWEKTEKISGLCMYISQQALKKVGLFDEKFGIGYFEDDDFCLRTKDAGLTIAWAKDIYVHHFGSISFQSKDRDEHLANGMRYFIFKWGKRALEHIRIVHKESLLRSGKNSRNTQASSS